MSIEVATPDQTQATPAKKTTGRRGPHRAAGKKRTSVKRDASRLKRMAKKAAAKKTVAKKTTASSGSRNVLLAELRSRVEDQINNASRKVTQTELEKQLGGFLKPWTSPVQALRKVLHALQKAKLISSERVGNHYLYWGPKTKLTLEDRKTAKTTAVKKTTKKAAAEKAIRDPKARTTVDAGTQRRVSLGGGIPDFTVDYVKSTKRLRLQFGKIVMDVGVVEQ